MKKVESNLLVFLLFVVVTSRLNIETTHNYVLQSIGTMGMGSKYNYHSIFKKCMCLVKHSLVYLVSKEEKNTNAYLITKDLTQQ